MGSIEWGEWSRWTVSSTGGRTRGRKQGMGTAIAEKDKPIIPPELYPFIPLEPPQGQRCSGRNYQGRRCCTPEKPCGEGEGDCDGHDGCQGDLICGSSNCKQFGHYYHEKDDCCEKSVQAFGVIDLRNAD